MHAWLDGGTTTRNRTAFPLQTLVGVATTVRFSVTGATGWGWHYVTLFTPRVKHETPELPEINDPCQLRARQAIDLSCYRRLSTGPVRSCAARRSSSVWAR